MKRKRRRIRRTKKEKGEDKEKKDKGEDNEEKKAAKEAKKKAKEEAKLAAAEEKRLKKEAKAKEPGRKRKVTEVVAQADVDDPDRIDQQEADEIERAIAATPATPEAQSGPADEKKTPRKLSSAEKGATEANEADWWDQAIDDEPSKAENAAEDWPEFDKADEPWPEEKDDFWDDDDAPAAPSAPARPADSGSKSSSKGKGGGDFGKGEFASAIYKTRMCKGFSKGNCWKASEDCIYAHGEEELRKPPKQPCYKFLNSGWCAKGDECTFSHDAQDASQTRTSMCKGYSKGTCFKGPACRYMHTDEDRGKEVMVIGKRPQEFIV